MALVDAPKSKCFPVKVTTMEADLEFEVEQKALGRDLFDLVCRTVGLREIWYFGLQFTNSKNYFCWLQMDKKVLKQDVKKSGDYGPIHFYFLVKFYAEDIESDLIQDVTRHLFFLQVKQSILNMEVYCQPEASVLLASYAVQAQFGDYEEANGGSSPPIILTRLLPAQVIDQYQMTTEMWEDKIRTWWSNTKGLSREGAELEYLKVAQDLHMYGVQYFPISNKKGSKLWLGVGATGVAVYPKENRMEPTTRFSWAEIRNISFKEKKFTIKMKKEGAVAEFWSDNIAVNQVILDLSVGTHSLYLRRRLPDTLELQQMKDQAKEERMRRQADRARLERQVKLNQRLEAEKEGLAVEVEELRARLSASEEAMRRSEETVDLLGQKARLSEEEALALAKRASEAEAEIQRIKVSAISAEEEKLNLLSRVRDAELMAKQFLEESERRTKEAERLRSHLAEAREAEKEAKDRLLLAGRQPSIPLPHSREHCNGYDSPTDSTSTMVELGGRPRAPPPDPLGAAASRSTAAPAAAPDFRFLSAEIEKERAEYAQKSKDLERQLTELRTEIEGMKMEDRMTDYDRIYAANLVSGETKYSTLRKSAAGSAKARIQYFDGM